MQNRSAIAWLAGLAGLLIAGCGGAQPIATSTPSRRPFTTAPVATAPAPASRANRAPASHHPSASERADHLARQLRRKGTRQALRSLAYSTASNELVQPQPPPASCHALGSGLYERPDPACTPGALNPAVTQATIDRTICLAGWTASVRPPESISEREKAASMAAYGDAGPIADYEYDHFVPLELGGATNDPRNLWPEPGASPNPKDAVEDQLRREVCAERISLAEAQREIVANWTAVAERATPVGMTPAIASRSVRAASGGECAVTASYNDTYRDYDVYVRSNQPNRTIIVTAASGRSEGWRTDGFGYADVYLHAGRGSAGERITVRVGSASCQGTL